MTEEELTERLDNLLNSAKRISSLIQVIEDKKSELIPRCRAANVTLYGWVEALDWVLKQIKELTYEEFE